MANGVNPSENRKMQKSARIDRLANSFETIVREWFAKHSTTWSKNHGDRLIRRLERDIFPWIGGRPIAKIKAPELLTVIRRIENRGAIETAYRALANCGQVLRYAVTTGRAERDSSSDLGGALPPVKGTHFAVTTEPKRAGEILRALDGYEGTLTLRCALRLAPHVFVRPGELRNAQWADIDFDTTEWRYTVTKTNTSHIVALAYQALVFYLGSDTFCYKIRHEKNSQKLLEFFSCNAVSEFSGIMRSFVSNLSVFDQHDAGQDTVGL